MPEKISEFHNSHFDPVVEEAHHFTTSQLGLSPVDVSNVAVVEEGRADFVRDSLDIPNGQTGGFNIQTGEIALFPVGDTQNPQGATARLGSQLVHEFTHSATANLSEHVFFNEALAGMGEAKYLQWLQVRGKWQPVADFCIKRAGVEIILPGAFRYYRPSGEHAKQANTSQGLIAASGIGLGMHKSGTKVMDIMGVSELNGSKQFSLMKRDLEGIKSGLTREVESFPQSTDGIIQATAVIQGAAGKRSLIH